MGIANLLSRGLEFMERQTGFEDRYGKLTPETFTWNNASVQCLAVSNTATIELEDGGFAENDSLRLLVRDDHFLTVDSTLVTIDSELFTVDNDMPHPVAGRTLIFRGKTRRILSAKEAPGRGHYVLALGSPDI